MGRLHYDRTGDSCVNQMYNCHNEIKLFTLQEMLKKYSITENIKVSNTLLIARIERFSYRSLLKTREHCFSVTPKQFPLRRFPVSHSRAFDLRDARLSDCIAGETASDATCSENVWRMTSTPPTRCPRCKSFGHARSRSSRS